MNTYVVDAQLVAGLQSLNLWFGCGIIVLFVLAQLTGFHGRLGRVGLVRFIIFMSLSGGFYIGVSLVLQILFKKAM